MNAYNPDNLDLLDKKDKLDTLSWYLVAIAMVAIGFALVFIFLNQINYKDFFINGHALGLRLLYFAIICYVAGRAISYYKRFRKKAVK